MGGSSPCQRRQGGGGSLALLVGRAVARQGAALVNGHGLAPQLHGLA